MKSTITIPKTFFSELKLIFLHFLQYINPEQVYS